MKINIISLFLIFLSSTFSMAQDNPEVVDTRPHRVVMQVTQADSAFQLTVIGQIRNIKKALPHAEIEVICHSKGLPMLLVETSKVASHVEALLQQQVSFAACENTMRRQKVEAKDLLPGVRTVPSGLAEIILKQEAGWAYVKAGI